MTVDRNALKKFILKHFNVDDNLELIIDTMIADFGDELIGMSEYEMFDLYDETAFTLMKKLQCS